jgi:glycosyltransferase involved in cell wall biosynthesis
VTRFLATAILLATLAAIRPRRRPQPGPDRLRVIFDATWAAGSGGTARYVTSLARELDALPEIELVVTRSPRLPRGPRPFRLLANGVLHLFWTQLALPAQAWRLRADVLQTTMVAPLACPSPVAVTIHDALDYLPALRPSRVWSAYMRSVGRLAALRADLVLTGTSASAAEVARHYRVPLDRVRVTPYGVNRFEPAPNDHCVGRPQPPTPRLEDLRHSLGSTPFALMVGVPDRRKNLKTGIAAVRSLRERGTTINLVIVSDALPALDRSDWIHPVPNAADTELVWLFSHAVAVVVPSLHEGFGLPVLEALAAGTPVVASDLPALCEVGGDAVRYAPPGDVEAFSVHLAAIVADPAGERSRLAVATEAARRQTWAVTARETVAAYRRIAPARHHRRQPGRSTGSR